MIFNYVQTPHPPPDRHHRRRRHKPFPAAALYEKVKKGKDISPHRRLRDVIAFTNLATYSRFRMFGRLLRTIGQQF